jgi:hypothetical protein
MSWPEQRLRHPLGTARAACKGMYGPSTLFIKAIELAERKMTVSPRGGGTPLSELFVVGNPQERLDRRQTRHLHWTTSHCLCSVFQR